MIKQRNNRYSMFKPTVLLTLLMLIVSSCSPPKEVPQRAEGLNIELESVWQRNIGTMTELLAPRFSHDVFCTVSRAGIVSFTDIKGDQQGDLILLPSETINPYSAGVGCNNQYVSAVRGDGKLVVADIQGRIVWEKELRTRVFGSPLVTRGAVYVLGLDGRLLAYTLKQGTELWRYVSPVENLIRTPLDSSPILYDGIIYIGIDNGVIVALRSHDGRVLWENTVALPEGTNSVARILDVTTPVVFDDMVCASAYRGGISCFDRQNGKLLWTKQLSTIARVNFDKNGNRLFASGTDGNVYALDSQTGETLWRSKTGSSYLSAPVFIDDAVVVGDDNGTLFAYSADKGGFVNSVKIGSGRVSFLFSLASDSLSGVYGVTIDGDLFFARIVF